MAASSSFLDKKSQRSRAQRRKGQHLNVRKDSLRKPSETITEAPARTNSIFATFPALSLGRLARVAWQGEFPRKRKFMEGRRWSRVWVVNGRDGKGVSKNWKKTRSCDGFRGRQIMN